MPRPAVAAESSNDRVSSALILYFNGKAKSARQDLIAELDRPEARAPAARLGVLEAILDVCLGSYAQPCLVDYAPKYVAAAVAAAPSDPAARRILALKAAYYVDAARASVGQPQVTAQILQGEMWRQESTGDAVLYLRRQGLAADILLQQDQFKAAGERANRILSLIAALKNPQDNRFAVARSLSDTIATLLAAGQTERAFGLYAASAPMIVQALPPLTAEAVAFRLTEAQLLQETGRAAASGKALDVAMDALGRMELDPDVADWLLGRALTLKAVTCVFTGDLAGAKAALARHPYAARFAAGGKPRGYDETTYLAARALAGAVAGEPDAAAAEALAAPVESGESADVQAAGDVYRAAGHALALPPGAARDQALHDLGGRAARFAGAAPDAAFGAWRRVGLVDQLVVALALGQAPAQGSAKDAETAFALTQLAQRAGPSFDADALTLLDQARDEAERRAIHRALRLKARRDRLEREAIKRVAGQAATAAAGPGGALAYDLDSRAVFRDFADGIDGADRALAADGIATSGANLVALDRFQAVLGPGEAALSVTPLAGDVVAYMCVRRDAVMRSVAKADLQRAQIDARVIRAGLVADHAPSEELDSQFPVEAAVRLYEVLIRPFSACLKPGDRIIWLPNYASFAVPLSVLLDHAPPRAGRGYDLAQADWLVRSHAVSYPGSAAMVVAARTGRSGAGADFDFLGVGDPALTGARPSAPGAVDFSALEPLPETRLELEQSAKGFRRVRLLTGAQATEANFRGQLVGAYRFLSFATHGLIRDDLPGLSEPALVLTPSSTGGEAGDGLLTAAEIADLNLAARFVALSACNTANYDLAQFSQDLPALASAFAVAGVPATLATLWPVDSETSRRVVTASFAALRANADAADALAAAQRDFLAAPPGKAYLHPRFWAPFVLLGDGAPPRADAAPGLALEQVATLTDRGGEVIALRRQGDRTFARLTGGRDEAGAPVSAVAATAGDAVAWTQESPTVGASPLLLALGDRIVAGGRARGPDGRIVPMLQSFEPRSGRTLGEWRGVPSIPYDAVVAAGAETAGAEAAILAIEVGVGRAGDPAGQGVHLLLADGRGAPRLLATTHAPPGVVLSEAAVARLGADVLVAYSARSGPLRRSGPDNGDDYDRQVCAGAPTTWLELRDARTGERRAFRTLTGYLVVAAKAGPDGKVLLAGAAAGDCAAGRRAVVLSVGADLKVRTLYTDGTQGDSEARGLAIADGGALVAAAKINVLEYRQPSLGPRPPGDRAGYASGMIVALASDSAAGPPKMLDSGGDLFLDDVATGPGGEATVGGSLGGEATLFRLKAGSAAFRPAPAKGSSPAARAR